MGNRIITLLMILMVAPLPLASIRNHNYRHSCRPIQAGLFPFWNKSSKSQKKNSLEDLKLNKDNNFFPNDEDPKKGPSGADVIHSGLTPNLSIVTGDPSTDPTTLYLSLEQMNALGLTSGDIVRVKGRRRRDTIAGVKSSENVDRYKAFVSKDMRRNLRLRNSDVIGIEPLTGIPMASRITILPFSDDLKRCGMDLSIIAGHINQSLFDFFSLPRPLRLGDHFHIHLPNGQEIEFKVLRIESSQGDSEAAIVSPDTIFNLRGKPLDREKDDDSFGEIGYDDIGGMKRQLSKIRELIELPLHHPEVFQAVGISPPKGILLHGLPGTGKTLIAKAIAAETGANFYVINGPEIVSKHFGDSESNLRKIFETAEKNAPSIIFIDEIDSIGTKRDKLGSEAERRIVSQLLTCMDGLYSKKVSNVLVLAATNRANALDSALRRFGRFDREIEITACDEDERFEILLIKTRDMKLSPDVDLRQIAKACHGYVGADISQLCFEAAMECIRQHFGKTDILFFHDDKIPPEILNKIQITKEHFDRALSLCNPSSLRERSIEVPETTWDDIGGLEDVKRELIETVQYPVEHPEKFKKFGQSASKGVLFYGPPGCGKTLLARAIAHECKANFISVKGPELLTMWFGESEANVRELFDKARAAAPCILFFDEMDSIAKERGTSHGGGEAADRVINQILTEIDGVSSSKPIFIIGATNRPDILDPAITRPGRLDQLIYIPLPDRDSRESIFKACLRNSPLAPDVNIKKMADDLEGYSGADISEVCKRAAKEAIRESIAADTEGNMSEGESDKVPFITNKHFQAALASSRRSIRESDIQRYKDFKNRISS
ncbi:Cell division cycle protein 48 homolog [Babesia microti strain RI]|uniref:Cell division cycle protein 48 homolog n=1 Tax=Babesia microti (strain RI) TaxID=1133968 RepID=A0A1N6LWU5_BABMR|nr:Cell division cycle protein 48 homolog [Babesia microti strain RI]SIO73342.1 Cell division cycle protein 48 homolog [Babesia microti strain RI]|eukprot:XP_021337444.1 Cell division cycle protein 48 homolog [Babesia microti strain RI]